MPDELPGPSLGELRAAGVNLMAAGLAASMFPHALKAAADYQRYLIDARTVGASREDAERVLTEVRDELLHTGQPPSRAFRIAYRRLLEDPSDRPPEPVRAAARQLLRCEGAPFDPESVDREAWRVMRFAEDWHAGEPPCSPG